MKLSRRNLRTSLIYPVSQETSVRMTAKMVVIVGGLLMGTIFVFVASVSVMINQRFWHFTCLLVMLASIIFRLPLISLLLYY